MSAILNYTTEIPVERTIGEIEKLLAQSGADKILKEYDGKGGVTSISFRIETSHGSLPFRLPMNEAAVMQVINNQTGEYHRVKRGGMARNIPQRFYNDHEQARRVGWRIIKDWLEAQLALLFLQMVKVEEIFLPYMYNERTGKTMFQSLEERNFKLQLEHNMNSGEEE
jgi:hypothetical protein